MKDLASGLIVGILLWAGFGNAAQAAEAANLLSNPGFEDGLTGWLPDAGHELVTDSSAAHAGQSCLSGEVNGPREALFLRRRVPVKQGNRYEFSIWAKATGQTKLVLWVIQPGAQQRSMVSAWERVPRQWRRYTAAVPIRADGMLELIIVAPSSHNAPPGQMWVDDISLLETEMPPVVMVSDAKHFNDEPALARTDDGSLYVAWNSFRDGADSLQVARYRTAGDRFSRVEGWQICGGNKTFILGPTAVAAGAKVVILYAAEVDGNWDIYAVTCDAAGPGDPVRITSHDAVDLKPATAWHGDTLWVAWESNRNGCRQVFAASLKDGEVSEPTALSPSRVSSYAPSVAIRQSGEVCVAWHGFRENNYDVLLCRRSPAGTWGDVVRLTEAPAIDRHPQLVARGDELWLLYEHALTSEYRIGATNQRRLILAQVTPSGLLAPKTAGGPNPLGARCEAPTAAFDASGRLWVAYLQPRLPRAGWDALVTCFLGDRWMSPMPLSSIKGMDRRPILVLDELRPVVAFQADDIPNSWSDVDRTLEAKSNVYLAMVKLDDAPVPGGMSLAPLVEPDEPFEAGQLRVARGEDTPTRTIEYQGQTLKLFFGDLHEHTDVSVCNRVGDQSIDESYQHMRDIARHDFACVTDHGYNLNPYLWCYTAKMARVNEDPGRFLTFLAEEWTSSFEQYSTEHPYGFYGHRNLILADTYFPRWWNARNGQNPAQVWEELRKLDANFVHIPHQLADTGNVPTDWNFADQKAQPVAEIFQVRGSYEYKGTPREAKRTTPEAGYFIQDAWARGLVIGVIASPDHGGGYGKACVFAPELSREAILDALRRRHCYGTTAAKMFLDVRVDGHLMGETIAEPAGDSVEVRIETRCPGDIDRIEVCRNNRFIYSRKGDGRSGKLTFFDREPLEGRSYYYVRVIQKDEEIAWSSPVWFGAE